MKRIDFEGAVHEFPDDFSDAEIATALQGETAAPDTRSAFGRFWEEKIAKPATGALAKGLELAGETGLSPYSLKEPSEAVAGAVVPQTATQAAIMAGTAAGGPLVSGAAKLGVPLAGKIAPWLARILGGTAAGAVGEGVETGRPLVGAAKGAAVTTAGEGAGAFASKLFRGTALGRSAINRADAERFGEAAGQVAPTLKPGTSPAELASTAEGQGLARIGVGKEAAAQDIEARLAAIPGQKPDFVDAAGQAWVRVAGGGWQKARAAGDIPMPSLGEPSMALRDANAKLSEIGDMMRGIKPLDPRFPKDVNLKEKYGEVADDIRRGIESVAGPDVAAAWTSGQAQYRAGREIGNELLGRTNLFTRRGQFNLSELQNWLRNPANREDLARSLGGDLKTGQNLGAYDQLVNAITRGAPVGRVDKLAGEAPGFFSGRGSYGSWRAPVEVVRRLFPNLSSQYVGRVPYTIPSRAQTALDLALEQALAR